MDLKKKDKSISINFTKVYQLCDQGLKALNIELYKYFQLLFGSPGPKGPDYTDLQINSHFFQKNPLLSIIITFKLYKYLLVSKSIKIFSTDIYIETMLF